MSHPLGRLAVVHPFPSFLNGALVAALYLVAGGQGAAWLPASAMIGFQVSIGALNDLADSAADAVVKPWKPIPAGLVSRRAAALVVVAGGLMGGLLSATLGAAVLIVGLSGYACGVAYDLRLKRAGMGWLAFAAAFPLALVYAWLAATGAMPPHAFPLLPIAALAGPTLNLANTMVDQDDDAMTGVPTLAVRLGPRRSVTALMALVGVVYGGAWLSLLLEGGLPRLAVWGLLLATVIAALGLFLSARSGRQARSIGWALQAIALAMLALGWLAAVAP